MNVSADLAALFFYLFSLFHHFTRSPSNYKGISLILSLSVLKQQPLGWKCTHQTSSQTVENFVSTAGIQQGKRNLVVFVMATSKLFCNRYLKFNGSFFCFCSLLDVQEPWVYPVYMHFLYPTPFSLSQFLMFLVIPANLYHTNFNFIN